MFQAELISLSKGQSYDNVTILERSKGDFENHGIPPHLGNYIIAFYHGNDLIICNQRSIRVIQLDRAPRKGDACCKFDRIVLDGDIIYPDGHIIHSDNYEKLSIPLVFDDPFDTCDQVAFSCQQGIFITTATSVVSLIIHRHRGSRGVTRAIPTERGLAQAAKPQKKISRS